MNAKTKPVVNAVALPLGRTRSGTQVFLVKMGPGLLGGAVLARLNPFGAVVAVVEREGATELAPLSMRERVAVAAAVLEAAQTPSA